MINKVAEVREFHPLVKNHLTSLGYECDHEYKLPDAGRVDYLARKGIDEMLLVECKPDPSDIAVGVIQVVGYRAQILGSNAAIATSKHVVSQKTVEVCQKYDVQLIQIDKMFHKQWHRRITKLGWLLETYSYENGVTAFGMAKEMKVANTTVMRLMNGKHRASVPLIIKISKMTGYDVLELIEMVYPEIKELTSKE